jgi:hypothetical protein
MLKEMVREGAQGTKLGNKTKNQNTHLNKSKMHPTGGFL